MSDHRTGLAAQARAVRAHKQRVVVSSRLFSDRGMEARVLVSGEYYDVNERELAQLESGLTPADLELYPAVDD